MNRVKEIRTLLKVILLTPNLGKASTFTVYSLERNPIVGRMIHWCSKSREIPNSTTCSKCCP